jgi:hypothetical protein
MQWRGYSVKSLAGPLHANALLRRAAIEDACEHGCRFYGMGQSSGVESLEHFKETFGAVPSSAPELLLQHPAVSAVWNARRRTRSGIAQLAMASRPLSRGIVKVERSPGFVRRLFPRTGRRVGHSAADPTPSPAEAPKPRDGEAERALKDRPRS